MATDGTTYSIDIQAPTGNAESAASAVAKLSSTLTGATSAAKAAADAVKSGEAAYKQAEKAADAAAKALEKINVAMQTASGKTLQNLTARQAEATEKAKAASKAVLEQATALDKLKAKSTAADSALAKMQKSATTGNLGKAGSELKGLGGPLGSIAQKVLGTADAFGDLKEALGSGGIYAGIAVALAAMATGVAALTAAAAAGVATIGAWAVGLADAARTQQLLTDGIARSESGGSMLAEQIQELQKEIPLSRDELLKMASDLRATGLEGSELGKKLKEGAEKAAKAKFGPNYSKQLLAISAQTERFKTLIAGIFGGLRIEKLLEGFKKLVDLFDTTSVTGRAIKVLFESLFQPLVDGVVNFIPKMVSMFIQFEILVLKAMIAIKPFGSTILLIAEYFAYAALVVGGVLTVALVGIALPFLALAGFITLVIAGLIELTNAFMSIGGVLNSVGTAMNQMGIDMINGLVGGITGAASSVVKALTGVVNDGITAAKQALGIASPSKVFAEIGMHTADGMAGGIEDGTGDVQGSMQAMVSPDAAAATAGGGASSASGGGGAVYNFVFNGVAGAEDARDMFIKALEDLVTQSGKASPA